MILPSGFSPLRMRRVASKPSITGICTSIDAVVIFVGIAAEIIVQLGHALGDAKVAQGDLFFSALQCDGVESCFRNTIRESSTVSELET